jgi:phosphomannomutase/phosphoglucomutase
MVSSLRYPLYSLLALLFRYPSDSILSAGSGPRQCWNPTASNAGPCPPAPLSGRTWLATTNRDASRPPWYKERWSASGATCCVFIGKSETGWKLRAPLGIYHPCDVVGHATAELKPELYRSWGLALGRQLEPNAKFIAGGDVRGSTPPFLAALVDGLSQAGLDVLDLGSLPTPMIYYAKRRLGAAGCAIVTASHHPAAMNGLRWMLGGRPPTGDQVRLLEQEAESPAADPTDRLPSPARTLDVSFDYVAWLQETWIDTRELQLRIVLDPGHGCWSARARQYLQAVFPRCLFSAIHDTPDPEFNGRTPDCSRPDLLTPLSDAVYHERAHLGIAFDGDGDRVAFVDNDGTVLTAEETTWILLDSFGPELEGEPLVLDLKFSDRIPEAASGLGANPLSERSGHAFIHARMLDTGAPFGAATGGHYFFQALDGDDDGLFAACRMIAHLGQSEGSLADLRRTSPAVFITPDLRVAVEPNCREDVIEQVRAAWSQYPQTTVDGVRVSFPDGWALMRNSMTEPALTFRFEAADWGKLPQLVYGFCDTLGDIGDALWREYEIAMIGTDACQAAWKSKHDPGQ